MSLMPRYGQSPGISAISQTTEKVLWWGREEMVLYGPQNIIKSTAVDAGSSPTTLLRQGLIMGVKTSDQLWYQCDPNASDGTEVPAGILDIELSMLDAAGVVENKLGAPIIIRGPVRVENLLIEGTAFTSSADEFWVRSRMAEKGFLFNDDYWGKLYAPVLHGREVAKTADYTVVAADNGTLFHTTGAAGAVIFTLPAFKAGLVFEFLNTADQTMKVTSPTADNIVWKNDLSVDTLSFETATELIGAHLRLRALESTAKWMVDYLGPPDLTVTAVS